MACGQKTGANFLDNCRDLYLGTPFVVDYGACPACELVQQIPSPVDTLPFYPESYPQHHPKNALHQLARKYLIRGVYYQPSPGDRTAMLLDFGCGDGSYLQSIRTAVGECVGFEPSPDQAHAVSRRLGCKTYSNLREAGDDLAGRVDIITAHFVLEHLIDLQGTFQFWNHVLKPGGILHLALPHIRSWEARLFGRRWHGLDAPRHVSFPGSKSMSLLAANSGLRIVSQGSGIFPNTLAASMATVLAGHYQQGLFLAFIPLGFAVSALFPQGTAIFRLQKLP